MPVSLNESLDCKKNGEMDTAPLRGVLSPVVTPFDENLEVRDDAWLAHCRWLLSQDCGLAIFGTNSEANSLSMAERRRLLDLAAGELDTSRMMPGTGACTIPDAVELTLAATDAGCAGVLMLPPFYYKGVSDEGLFAFYSEVIQRCGDDRLRLYLYHIPQVAQVPISPDLIERLLSTYPGTVAGIKDSSGDWEHTRALIERFDDLDVFPGSEEFLLDALRMGGAGCISATANINPAAIRNVFVSYQAEDALARQESITAFRKGIEQFPLIPALKATIAIHSQDPGWSRVRPPLVALSDDKTKTLSECLDRSGFSMLGWGS